jgi:hypothetical protein
VIPPEVVAADLLLLAVVAVITVPVLVPGQRMTVSKGARSWPRMPGTFSG